MSGETPARHTLDPETAKRVREHEKFERSMSEKGLLQDDKGIALEPEDVKHDTPPGTEQTAG